MTYLDLVKKGGRYELHLVTPVPFGRALRTPLMSFEARTEDALAVGLKEAELRGNRWELRIGDKPVSVA